MAERTIGRLTGKFNDLVGQRDLTFGVGLFAVALALLLGASHALLPGHGKTVMAAYLAGREGSARTLCSSARPSPEPTPPACSCSDLALTLSASLAGDAVLGWMGVVSGLLVAALGAGLLRSAMRKRDRRSGHSHSHGHPMATRGGHSHEGGHRHERAEPTRVSRRGLVGLGVAGGLVPSPSALVVLLAAIALGRTIFGVVLVFTYGLGMAATLTVAGLVLVRVRDRLHARPAGRGRRLSRLGDGWVRAMPFATASLVVVVGIGLAGRSAGGI